MRIEKVEIDFSAETLHINGKKVEQPIIVEIPTDGGYKSSKIFNFVKGCCGKEKLPKLSVTEENLGSIISSGNTF